MKKIKSLKEFEQLIKGPKPVLIDFYAEWCPPCKVQLPILEKINAKHGNEVEIAKVDVDNLQDISQKYGIRSIPTIIAFDKNNIIYQKAGLHSESNLEELISKLN